MSEVLKCPKCSSDLGTSGGQYCCWNSACNFRSHRPWITPPEKYKDHEIPSELEAIIGECLNAVAIGPFLVDIEAKNNPYWEYQALLGFTHEEVNEISRQWPNLDISDVFISELITSCFATLLGYPHMCEEYWPEYLSVSKQQLIEFGNSWRQSKYVQSTLSLIHI